VRGEAAPLAVGDKGARLGFDSQWAPGFYHRAERVSPMSVYQADDCKKGLTRNLNPDSKTAVRSETFRIGALGSRDAENVSASLEVNEVAIVGPLSRILGGGFSFWASWADHPGESGIA
jgi:hypothetical protein